MRNKQEILKQLTDMNSEHGEGKLTDFDFRMLQEAIKIEVMIDLRDIFLGVSKKLKDNRVIYK